MTNASQGAKDFVKGTQNGTESLNNMTKASKAAELGMRALATVGNMALVFAITETISVIYNCINASENLQKAAAEAGSEFKSTKESIEDYRQKIADLHETINSSTASYEETYSARGELLKIQDEMIEKFGSEAESIDKVKDAINGVDEAFDNLTNDEWGKAKNNFNSDTGEGLGGKIAHFFSHDFGHSSNIDKMMEEMGSTKESFHIASAGKTKEEQEKLDKFVEELRRLYNINIYRDPDGHNVYDKIEVAGDNLKDIYSKMLDIQKLGKSIGLDDSFLGNLSEKNGKIQNKIDQYDEMYNENIFQEKVLKDENLAQKYKDITQAYKDSQEVIKNGGSDEDVKAAQEKVAKLIQEATDGLTDNSIITFFEEMYPDLQDVVGKWKFKVDFEANKDRFDDSIRDLISHFDSSDEIKNFSAKANPENVQYYDDLVAKANEYGLSVDQLIDKLEELGEIQSQRKIDLVDKLVLNDESKKITDWGLSEYEKQIKDGTVQTKFGNVDMDKRTIIRWSDELKKTYAEALSSWDYDPEIGSIDTVFGASGRFGENLNNNGWEVAFTPILPDGTFLSKDTVEQYINSILEEAYVDDGKVTDDELKEIDAQGRWVGNTFVQGIYAGIDDSLNYDNNGNQADVIGRLMHFAGKFGAIFLARNGDDNKDAKEQINKFVNSLSEDDLKITQTKDFDKALEEQKKNLNGATLSLENYQAALEKAKEANPTITFKVEDLTKKIDEIQNTYKTLRDAIKEYNKEGYISVDTFQSIMALSPEYLKYLVDENGNLRLNEQALKDVAIARIQDMVIAQKIAVLDTAKTWTDEADALKYLKGNLDDASKSKEEFLNKQLKEVQLKWAEQTDENGNRKFSDKDIQENTKGILSVWSDIDTLGNSAINGINNGLGMTGEGAKDVAKNIKDINKQLDDLAKSEALQKLKYKFDQLEQGITKIDTALSLLNNISDLTYEDDYIGKIEIVSDQLDLATSKAQLLQNEFEQLSAEQYDTADSSNELASRMKSTADSIAENQKQIIEYGKNITSYYMSALSAINSLSKDSIERATTLIDRNIKTLSEGGLTGLEFSFVPTVPQSAIEKQRNENQSLKNEMQSYYNSVAEMQKTALDLQYKEQMTENEKKRQEILESLKEQQNDLNEHYATVEKAQESHNATTQEAQKQNDAQTQENQKQNDAAIITEQQNTQTNSLNGVKTYLTQFQTMIQGFIDWLAQNPLHPTVEFTNLNDIMDSTFIDSNNGNTLNGMAYYNQKNYSDSYAGGTIATSGCGVTSAAMVATTLTGKTITPSEVAKLAKEKGYEVSEGTSWGLFNNLGSIYNFHGEEIGKDDKSILAALNSGKKVIVSEGKGTWTSGAGHIIVLAGASDGKIMVNDPYSPEKSKKLWDIGDITKTAKGAWAYYAKGTKNFGIGGENYKTEYLRNKKTGEWHEINEPTLVNTDEYDVIGEKTSAKIKQVGKPLPMYATGTPISDPKVREMVKKASQETGVPANIVLAVIDQESDNTWSSGNPDSGGTSYGYMQLRTPGVLDDLPADRRQAAMTDKYSNILEGAKFLKRLFNNYSDWTKAASAYNQGEAGFKRHGINKYGKDVVARANSTAFVQAAQDLSSISTAVQAVSTDTSDIATNTDTIATKDMKAELQNIVDSTSTPTELAKYQDNLLNYIKDNNTIQGKNNDGFLAAWEKLQAEDETAKSVLADYDKQLTDNRWSDNYNEIKDGATKYASSYAINTIKAQTGVQVNELLKQYDDEKAVLDDILKYFRKRKADGASADELKVIAQTYSEQLQNVESTSDSYVSAIQSETDYLLNIAERNTKYVKDQITWQEKINEGLERQAKLTSNVNDKLSLQKDIIDGNDTKRELYQKQKDNAHRNVLDILNSDDKDYQEVLKQFQSVEPWFDGTGEFSAQYEADLARLGASTPKLVPYMKQIASLIQVYKKAWYDADNEMQQTLDDTASRIDEVYATRTDKITKAISNSEWVLDMLGDGNFDLRLEETNTQLQNNLDKTVEIKNQQEYVNELYQRGSITYEQFVEKSQTLQEDLQSVYTTIKSILNSIKQIKIDTIQKNIDDINDQLEEIHDASDRITDSIDARMDVLNDEKDELDELQDKWDKVASAVKKVLSDQKELLDDEKESVSDYWDDRIKAIEKANEETDRNISLLEKQKELSEAKEQQTALIYQNGKFTYQADPKAVQDAEYALAEEQRSIKQDKAKEALEEQKDLAIKNIEDQIDAINKYQEKWDEVFDWYKNEVNEQAAYDQLGADWMNDTMALKTSILNQVGNAYKNNESIIEGSINEEIKALEKQEKALDRQVKAQERAANAKIRDYNKEIRAIEQTSDKFD